MPVKAKNLIEFPKSSSPKPRALPGKSFFTDLVRKIARKQIKASPYGFTTQGAIAKELSGRIGKVRTEFILSSLLNRDGGFILSYSMIWLETSDSSDPTSKE